MIMLRITAKQWKQMFYWYNNLMILKIIMLSETEEIELDKVLYDSIYIKFFEKPAS